MFCSKNREANKTVLLYSVTTHFICQGFKPYSSLQCCKIFCSPRNINKSKMVCISTDVDVLSSLTMSKVLNAVISEFV